MLVSAIVAVSRNGVIGANNQLPWRLPADLQWFKQKTINHCIFIGRKNWQSIGRPLPHRTNIVLTRAQNLEAPGCLVVHSLEQALQHARQRGESEFFVAGGAEVYALAAPLVERWYITQVQTEVEGDVYLPPLGPEWREVWAEEHQADEKNPYPYRFTVWEK